MKYALFIHKIITKVQMKYRKRLFAEKTGQDVSSANFMGKVDVRNKNIKLGKNVQFRGDVILDGDGPIVIGDGVRLNHGTIILASKGGGVTIGARTGIAAYSYIIDMDHGTQLGDDYRSQPDVVDAIVIGENVWIGQNVTILKGSKIGNNAVCAAKTIITGKEVPENAIVAGVPGKIIKFKGKEEKN